MTAHALVASLLADPDPHACAVLAARLTSFGDPRLPDRFWAKCMPEPNSGCWLWFGALSWDGYGQFRMRLEPSHGFVDLNDVLDAADEKLRKYCEDVAGPRQRLLHASPPEESVSELLNHLCSSRSAGTRREP